MQNSHSIQYVLKTDNVDFAERWTLSSILAMMQNTADEHAVLLEAGKDQIAPRGYYWVIARTRVDMAQYPRYGDAVTIKTWPGKPERLTFPRYFRFFNASGDILGTATVLYMLLDRDTHKIVPPANAKIYAKEMQMLPEVNPHPERVRMRLATQEPVFRTPSYSDIDLNRHMNNTRYAQWICDLFPTSRFATHALQTFQINYIADGAEAHRIALTRQDNEDGSFVVVGTDTETNSAVFTGAGVWRKRSAQ